MIRAEQKVSPVSSKLRLSGFTSATIGLLAEPEDLYIPSSRQDLSI
jgi:hypothetical protein